MVVFRLSSVSSCCAIFVGAAGKLFALLFEKLAVSANYPSGVVPAFEAVPVSCGWGLGCAPELFTMSFMPNLVNYTR